MNKDIRKYFKQLQSQGWTIEQGRKSLKLRSPNGKLVTASLTPSCQFVLKYIQADVKRLGKNV